MAFRLYNVPSGGSPLYAENQTVQVINGQFSVVIGSIIPIPATVLFDAQYYIGIAVNVDPEMTPRQPLATTAYAFRSATTDALAPTATVPASQISGAIVSATSATKLAAARNINGVAFDGTADISVPATATGVTGLLKGSGGAVTAGVAGTDFVAPNAGIMGATNTRITYDAKGLVTAGAQAQFSDLGGTLATAQLANASVTAAKLASNGCTAGQILKYDGSAWACGADTNSGGTVTSITAGTGLTGGTITATGTIGLGTVPLANLAHCSAEGDVAVMHSGAWVCRSTLGYVNNGDGTVTDNKTGLMWGMTIIFSDPRCTAATPDVRCEQNTYTWSAASPFTDPTGTLYSDFLEKLNDLKTPNDGTTTTCFAGYCDWRIPTVGELRSMLLAAFPNCPSSPCIDATFVPTPGQASSYWSSSSLVGNPGLAWRVSFNTGFAVLDFKNVGTKARAVRSGR